MSFEPSGTVVTAEEGFWPGPGCDGGTIEKGEDGGWAVAPTNGATKVTITGLPEGAAFYRVVVSVW